MIVTCFEKTKLGVVFIIILSARLGEASKGRKVMLSHSRFSHIMLVNLMLDN
jgi:hypothetical protein